jgi:AcrR family transcriptional regulator
MKKRMTREAISSAALQLALDKGFEHLTIDQIARKAIVSPRTFSNYFSCKEEAVAAAGHQYWVDVIDRQSARPVDEHPLESMRALLVQAAGATSDENFERAMRSMRLGLTYPALLPFQVAQYDELEMMLRESVAARTETDPSHDLYPGLVAATAVAAMKAAISLWLINDSTAQDLPDMIGAAFDSIMDGLPIPKV